MHSIDFKPLPGLSSPHLQTILASFSPPGTPPPSTTAVIPLEDGDALCCEISTPFFWKSTDKTIILIHGLGGSHQACYMIRISRKFFHAGYKVVRVNMRSMGSGKGFARLPYHGGLSSDIYSVIKVLKDEMPLSPITVIGYSLGGNIALKLAGELGEKNSDLVHSTIAICPPVDLAETTKLIAKSRIYNHYYLHHLKKLTKEWSKGHFFSTVYEFDDKITAPTWGFKDSSDYYQASSSSSKLVHIKHPCHILLAADDPFINYRSCLDSEKSSTVKVWLSEHGGHMGFLGWADKEHAYHWLDRLLLKWVSEKV